MDPYTLQEQAYQRGYEKGFEDGRAEGFKAGYNQSITDGIQDNAGIGVWKWNKDGDLVCSNCGMLEPDSLAHGCTIWPQEKRFCFYCGTRLLRPEELK